VGLRHARQAIPQQEEIFGDDHARGISMVIAVGPPGGLLTASTPSKRAGRGRVAVDDLPGRVQGHAHGDQPGLRSVVQVPLDPAAG
jgi:hypothetical protein